MIFFSKKSEDPDKRMEQGPIHEGYQIRRSKKNRGRDRIRKVKSRINYTFFVIKGLGQVWAHPINVQILFNQ